MSLSLTEENVQLLFGRGVSPTNEMTAPRCEEEDWSLACIGQDDRVTFGTSVSNVFVMLFSLIQICTNYEFVLCREIVIQVNMLIGIQSKLKTGGPRKEDRMLLVNKHCISSWVCIMRMCLNLLKGKKNQLVMLDGVIETFWMVKHQLPFHVLILW